MEGNSSIRIEDSEMQILADRNNLHESPPPSSGEKIDVERGRFNSLRLYEVAEHELILIEKGTDSSLWLNFAIASISVFFSILAALLTLDYTNYPRIYVIFVVITVVSAVSTLLCGAFWLKTRSTQEEIFKTIRKRIKNVC
jgi:hypothetical protein